MKRIKIDAKQGEPSKNKIKIWETREERGGDLDLGGRRSWRRRGRDCDGGGSEGKGGKRAAAMAMEMEAKP